MSELNTERYNVEKEICLERRSVRKYLNKELPEGVLEDIVVTTQSAPTSINSQPYKMMIVRSQEDKEKLAKTMLFRNADNVMNSSATILFLSDLKPDQTAKEYGELQAISGHSEEGVKTYVHFIKWISVVVPFFGAIYNWFFNFYGLFTKVMRRYNSDTFSFAQTYLVIQQFVLLCQSYGLGTIILAGFDSWKTCKAFGIPSRYDVSAAVCVGYEDKTEVYKPSLRYKPETMIYEGVFGHPVTTKLTPLPIKQTWTAKTD